MKATQVQNLLSMSGGASRKRAEAIGTELRNAGLLPSGGRGLRAPEITCVHAAMFALAVAAADRVADAVDSVKTLSDLENRDGVTLLARLSAFICDDGLAQTCRYIRLHPAHPMAEITYRTNGTRELFFGADSWCDPHFHPESQGQGFVGRIGHIGGAAINQMAISGWTSSGWE